MIEPELRCTTTTVLRLWGVSWVIGLAILIASWKSACCVADTGIPGKQDYSKFQSWIMLAGFKGYGQSPENGAKPLVYACCAPEEDLRGRNFASIASGPHQ